MIKRLQSFFKYIFLALAMTVIFTSSLYAKEQDANAPQSSQAQAIQTQKINLGDDSDIFTIVPSTTAVTVTSSGSTTVSYTVTLASTVTQDVTNIGVDPGFAVSSTLVTATLAADNCSGQTLSPSSRTCTFDVVLQGVSGKTGSATLMPRVSGDSGRVYSVPTENNRVAVTVSNSAPVTLTSITITPSSPSIAVAATQQFTATGHYSDSSTANITSSVTWASSNTGVATITASGGLATGVSAGTTGITASLSGVTSSADTLTVTAVTPTLVSITITPSSPTANIPGTAGPTPMYTQLTATGTYSNSSTADITNAVNWTSSNTSYATVTTTGSTRGQVTGVSVPAGSTSTSVTITATDPGTSISATKAVTVQLVVGSFYNQGYVYCLGTSGGSSPCAFLPSGNCPSGQPCVGEVIAQTDNVSSTTGQQWYNGSYTTTGATSLTDGKTNTQTIVTSQVSGTYAANTCYTYNSGDSNNTWYLPAKDELNVIYQNLSTLNTAGATLNTTSAAPTYSAYWSSSEVGNDGALAQLFDVGLQYSFNKGYTVGVRCVRAF